jgi:hypothetical protein
MKKKKNNQHILQQIKFITLIVLLLPLLDISLTWVLPTFFGTYSFPTLTNTAYQRQWLDSSSSAEPQYFFVYLLSLVIFAAFVSRISLKIIGVLVLATMFIYYGLPMIDSAKVDYEIRQSEKERHRIINERLLQAISISDITLVSNEGPNSSQLRFTVHFDKKKLLPEVNKLQLRLSSLDGKFTLYTHSFELGSADITELLQIQKAVYHADVVFEPTRIKYDLSVSTKYSDHLQIEIDSLSALSGPGTDLIIPVHTSEE